MTTLLLAAFGSEPANSFSEARFAEPLGYAGGSAAYAAMAVWPAMALAARGAWPAWLRGAMFAVAAVQADLAFLPQARGAAVGLVLSIPFFVFFSSSRAWSATRVIVLAATVTLSVGPILDVSTAANNGTSIATALQDAALGIAITAAVAFLLGLLLVLGEARRPVYPGSVTTRRYRGPILVAGAVVLAIAVAISWGRASSEVSQRWSDFKAGRTSSESSGHLTQLGDPERYDYWRVAVKVTGESPLHGNGAGNFQDAYTVDRHEEKHSKYAHEIWLRFSSETGIIGVLLFAGFFLAAFTAVGRRRGRMSPSEQLLTAGLLAATAYFLIHASVDWIDEFPALLGPALAFPLLAGRLAEPAPSGPPRRQAAGLFAGLFVAGLALAALVPAYLSLRFLERAKAEAPANARAAYSDLDRAAYLNPLSADADVAHGRIALFRREYQEARAAFERAIEREEDWYPHFVLATIASHEGAQRQAVAQMKAALALDPVDDGVKEALARLRRGAVLDPIEAQEQLESETSERFFRLHPSESE